MKDKSIPSVIAGPCAAESLEQLLATAAPLAGSGVEVFRAGLWKPRTHPGCFEGVGAEGIPWMLEVKKRFGMKIATEVLSAQQAQLCVEAGLDIVWLGARTTASPFLVQEIADALSGSNMTVLVKNPQSADVELWVGAVERLREAGANDIIAVHRGCTPASKSKYRNSPEWWMPLELRRRMPGLPLLCDPSHIAGTTLYISEISQRALDLGFDGLMIECHCCPSQARSDAAQQLLPEDLGRLLSSLSFSPSSGDGTLRELSELREKIDILDERIVETLGQRLDICREIGRIKKEGGVGVRQQSRWNEVMASALENGRRAGIPENMIVNIFSEIHRISIEEQNKLLKYDSQEQKGLD